MAETISQTIAEYTVRPQDFSPVAAAHARQCMAGAIGAMLAGSVPRVNPSAPALLALAKLDEGHGSAPVFGTSLSTSPQVSALTSAALGFNLQADDISFSIHGHPSITLTPTILALCSVTRSPGSRVVRAFLLGYEVSACLGKILNEHLKAAGWHMTCLPTTLGAAVAASHLLELSAEQTAHALTIAADAGSGLLGNIGSPANALQIGRTASSGTEAALLAGAGVTGKLDIFEHRDGFFSTYAPAVATVGLLNDLGEGHDLATHGIWHKMSAGAGPVIPAREAAASLARKHVLDPMRIQRIDCWTTARSLSLARHHRPRTFEERQFSIEFAIGEALVHPSAALPQPGWRQRMEDPRVRRLLERVTLHEDKDYSSDPDPTSSFASFLRITRDDGRTFEEEQVHPKGSPGNEVSEQELYDKAYALASQCLPETRVRELLDCLDEVEALEDCAYLYSLLIQPGRKGGRPNG